MKHLLPPLPYDYASLEPHIDTRTMQLHHDKHHASYVDNLNAALKHFPELQQHTAFWLTRNLTKLPEEIRTAVHHNAGGHVNHSLFWQAMSPEGGGTPKGALAKAIDRAFGGFEPFKAKFVAAGSALFGSGWIWLATTQPDGGSLEILTTSGHDNPMMQGRFPLLVNDGWEHAYYLKYENRRAEYLKNWWSIVNWDEVARRLERSDHSAEERWETEGGHLLGPAT